MKSLVDKVNAVDAARHAEKVWFVEQQRIRQALAPNLWDSLVRALQAECARINANTQRHIAVERPNDSEARLKNAETGAAITLQFDPGTPCIWFTSDGPNGYFAFKVAEDGTGITLVDPVKKMALFTDEAATNLLARLV